VPATQRHRAVRQGIRFRVHEPSHDPDEPSRHHRRPADPRLDPCTRATGLRFLEGAKREEGCGGAESGEGRTGELADGDGGDGGEADVVERREVADHLGEGRVAVHHRVLRRRRRGDVRVHRGRSGGRRRQIWSRDGLDGGVAAVISPQIFFILTF
jgi:hypothetical protein